MNQKDQIYLYYSKNKLESSSSDISSILGGENPQIALVIRPMSVLDKKRDKAKKKGDNNCNSQCNSLSNSLKKPSTITSKGSKKSISSKSKNSMTTSPIHSPLCTSKYSSSEKSRKVSLDRGKVFKEIDEPFLLDSTPTENSLNSRGEYLDYKILSQQKMAFEELNAEVKKRYKSYDQEEEKEEEMQLNYYVKPPKEAWCRWLSRIIGETRSPSALLSLSNLIEGVINEKMLQGIINNNNYITIEKNELEKCYLPLIRNNTFTIEFKDKESQEQVAMAQIQTIQRFNCEALIVSICLLIVTIAVYLVNIFAFE